MSAGDAGRVERSRAIRERLISVRAEYSAVHEEAQAALRAKDYDRLTAIAARELELVIDYSALVDEMMRIVETKTEE